MKYTLLSLLCFISLSAFSQEERVVIVKRESGRRDYKPKQERDIDNYNAFKFDPLRMAIGELNFSWEHRLDDHVTFEVELGPTISNLGSNRGYFTEGDPNGTYLVHSQMGALASAAVRYYPLEDSKAMNKLYVSPRIKFRNYNTSYSSTVAGLSDQNASSNEFIFSFNVGFQQWMSHNFAFDYYIGAGIGSFRGNQYFVAETYDSNTNMWTYEWKEQTARYARFVGVIGVKVTVGN
jgi:hypothetical protein